MVFLLLGHVVGGIKLHNQTQEFSCPFVSLFRYSNILYIVWAASAYRADIVDAVFNSSFKFVKQAISQSDPIGVLPLALLIAAAGLGELGTVLCSDRCCFYILRLVL